MKNADEPAFPNEGTHQFAYNGLTKREYFAAMAMQGLLANGCYWNKRLQSQAEEIGANIDMTIAVASSSLADELLKQLER